jgi:DNA anti-recombination protein RmuC
MSEKRAQPMQHEPLAADENIDRSVFSMEASSREIGGLASEISDEASNVADRIRGMAEVVRKCESGIKHVSRQTERLHNVSDELTTLTAAFKIDDSRDKTVIMLEEIPHPSSSALLSVHSSKRLRQSTTSSARTTGQY